jgi:cysteine synthase A
MKATTAPIIAPYARLSVSLKRLIRVSFSTTGTTKSMLNKNNTPSAMNIKPAISAKNLLPFNPEKIAKVTENSFIVSQFENLANSDAHYKTTGPEILKNTEGCVDIFVSAIGTGGTITGTAKYLKEHKPSTLVYGVEPSASPLLTKGVAGPHKIQGIGANFVPKILDTGLIDEIITVSDDEAYEYARLLAKKEGILCGISSGAALCGAIKLASKLENKTIVVLLPDTGLRYLSTDLF